jgi:hypothetical protein
MGPWGPLGPFGPFGVIPKLFRVKGDSERKVFPNGKPPQRRSSGRPQGSAPSRSQCLESQNDAASDQYLEVGANCPHLKFKCRGPAILVTDVVAAIKGQTQSNSAVAFKRLQQEHPEVIANSNHFKYKGRGQRDTPVTDVRGIAENRYVAPLDKPKTGTLNLEP